MDTSNPVPLIFIDAEETVTGWSDGAEFMLGWQAADVVGRPLQSLRPEGDERFRTRDGRLVDLSISTVAAPGGLTALALRAHQSLREQLELTLSHSEVIGTWDWDIGRDRVMVDARFAAAFGLDPDEARDGLPLERFTAGIHDADRERVASEILHTLTNGGLFTSEYRVHHADGRLREVAARGRFVPGVEGRAARLPGVLFDVTERREAEREAMRHQGRYRSLFERLDAGFCIIRMIFDEDGKPVDYEFLEVNAAFRFQSGIEDAVGRRMREIAPHHEQFWFDLYGKVARDQEAIAFENPASELDGRWFEVQAFPIDGPGSGHVAVLFNDRSSQRRMEMALRASEAEFRTLSQSMLNHVWTADPAGRSTWFNDRVYDFTGCGPEDMPEGLTPFIHEDDRASALSAWQNALETGTLYQTEYRLRRKDHVYRWHLVRAVPVRDEAGRIQRWIGTNTDIEHAKRNEAALAELNATLESRIEQRTSELMITQKALQQSQKMETIGQLTGGVAHDFNNLLQVVAGNLQLLARDVAGNERAERRVTNALAGVSRGAKLASQLLAFGRRQALEPKVINIARFLNGMDDLLRRSIGEAVEVETIVSGGLWNTFVDPTQVENAVLNLAINARDAMKGAGTLTIEVANASLDADYARAHADVEPGQYVMVAVTDTGAGMTPEVLERVFDPFFSTKPEGKGSGLGLSMVYGFVKQSGGHVKIYSELGQGTTVRLYLPRAHADEDREVAIKAGPIVGGNETILVVEDDEAVRETVVETLSELGYRVLTARDAQAGLTVVESGIPIDLVFTDVVMPGPLKSREMARRAKERLPELVVLFTSGYTENSIVHGGKLDAGVELLSKPYTREALARRLRHLLANRDQARMAAGFAPPSRGSADAAQRPADGTVKVEGPCRVLLVEDDDLIRMNTADLLDERGYEVCEAATAGAALALFESREIDVLVTDLGLPDMPGSELARRIRAVKPQIGVVFATGDSHLPAQAVDKAVLLGKPYDGARLERAVEAARKA
ncbi:PAS domain-containing protein [Rhizobium sp. YIM 134829]|uniref:PAS domain-containing protein n=1 Tax=Rhizobium sp. YIM 134829 TaxID=3390453 RepID=UPI00397B9B67